MVASQTTARKHAHGVRHGSRTGQGRPYAVTLRELVEQTAPLKVDRDKGVIYHVKVLGWDSVNDRKYLPEAGRKALPLYENCKVFHNHPTGGPEKPRLNDDGFGRLRHATWESDGIYADLHYFKSHPMADRICEDVERGIGFYGMSHNANGVGTEKDGILVINEITDVRSVDVVSEAATVTNLWESSARKRHMSKTTVKAYLEEHVKFGGRPKHKAFLDKLLEDDAYDMEMDELPDEDAPSMDEADHLFNAFKVCRESDPDKANKILALLRQELGDSAEEEEDDTEEEETPAEFGKDKHKIVHDEGSEDEPTEEEEDVEEEEEPDDKKGKEESKKGKKAKPGQKAILERCKSLCKLAGLDPEQSLLEDLAAIGKDSVRLRLLERMKREAAKPGGQRPQSQAPGNGPEKKTDKKQLQESKNRMGKTPIDMLAYVRN